LPSVNEVTNPPVQLPSLTIPSLFDLTPLEYQPQPNGGVEIISRSQLERRMSSLTLSTNVENNLNRGCVGLCSAYQGLNGMPENAPGTQCFLDPGKAMARKCPDCETSFVFSKQGTWTGGIPPVPDPTTGQVPTDSITNGSVATRDKGHFNYVTYFPSNGTFAWMNHNKDGTPQKAFLWDRWPSLPDYPNKIYCTACLKKK
jgi:hypothetical protein